MIAEGKEVRTFRGEDYLMEEGIFADVAFVKGWKADESGNLIFRKTARNFNEPIATAARVCVAEVEEIVPVGTLDPDSVHLPGIYVKRLVCGALRQADRVPHQPSGGALMPWTRDQIAARPAHELRDGFYVNLGIGIPTLVVDHVPGDITVTLHSENGLLGIGPFQPRLTRTPT